MGTSVDRATVRMVLWIALGVVVVMGIGFTLDALIGPPRNRQLDEAAAYPKLEQLNDCLSLQSAFETAVQTTGASGAPARVQATAEKYAVAAAQRMADLGCK